MTGSITIAPGGALSGTVSSLSYKAEKIVASSTLSGNFSISSSNVNNSPNLGAMTVSGTASSFIEKYTDGSILSLTNLALPVSSSTVISPDLLGNEKNFAGDDVFDIVMGSPLTKAWTFASGAGNDKISLQGGGNSVLINAGTGNDTIRLADDGHVINGGAGNDTVILSANRAAYTISKTVDGYNLQTNGAAGPIDTLSGVERLQFSDATMALDISGTGGQAYRLYQAAFNRVPDSAGLGYWISAMDKGMALNDVAALFVSSKEFTDLYGTNPSNTDFLNSMYQNVLHRAGDPAGFAFWLGHMNAGDVTRSEMLAYFGESTENQAALLGSIGNGFTYSPWG
nr:DUF4214 domain-containing protein [Pseudoduganella danionis]